MSEYQYRDFLATHLYCPTCKGSMPVVERLILILPDGYLYEYSCRECGEVLGDKKETLGDNDRRLFSS